MRLCGPSLTGAARSLHTRSDNGLAYCAQQHRSVIFYFLHGSAWPESKDSNKTKLLNQKPLQLPHIVERSGLGETLGSWRFTPHHDEALSPLRH